jgi:hypothetical protein
MTDMRYWAVVLDDSAYATERLFAHTTVDLPSTVDDRPALDDPVLLIGGEPRVLFGLGRITAGDDGRPVVAYTHRMLDEPLSTEGLDFGEATVSELDKPTFDRYAGGVGAHLRVDGAKQDWLVSLDLPIEAASPAEAVRAFWSYVTELGPVELPVFVTPADDELSMQAFVLGEQTNLDPEEEST